MTVTAQTSKIEVMKNTINAEIQSARDTTFDRIK